MRVLLWLKIIIIYFAENNKSKFIWRTSDYIMEKVMLTAKKILAPFIVVKHFGYYILWWSIIIITIMGPAADACLHGTDAFDFFIVSGSLYYSIITLLFSFVATNIIDVLFERVHDKGELAFLPYQLVSIIFAIFFIIIILFLYLLYRNNAFLQIVISLFGYIYSFYLYCISCLPKVRKEMAEFEVTYDQQIKENVSSFSHDMDVTSDGIALDEGDR